MGDPAELVCFLQYCVEHRGKLSGRGIDDLQHPSGRGLLLQGFARLAQEPRILHRDYRLGREILQQRDLLPEEGPCLFSTGADQAQQQTVAAQR